MKRRKNPFVSPISRRRFVAAGISGFFAATGPPAGGSLAQDDSSAPRKLRVAAVNSIFRLRSHAYHIIGRMVFGFQKDALHHQPNLQVARMYDDQAPPDDLGPGFCRRHGIELVKTPAAALGGAGGLDVDA